MEFVLVLAWILWLALIANAWYILLVPFWIGIAVGAYRRSFKFPLWGFVASFVLSWVTVFVAILTARFN